MSSFVSLVSFLSPKRLLLFFFLSLGLGIVLWGCPLPSSGPCTEDGDCRADEICDQGQCRPSSTPPGPSGPPPCIPGASGCLLPFTSWSLLGDVDRTLANLTLKGFGGAGGILWASASSSYKQRFFFSKDKGSLWQESLYPSSKQNFNVMTSHGPLAVALGSQNALFLSEDSGQHWRMRASFLAKEQPQRIALHGKTLLVATKKEVYFSSDLGQSWSKPTRLEAGEGSISEVALSSEYAAALSTTYNTSKLFVSFNAGQHWHRVTFRGEKQPTFHRLCASGSWLFAAGKEDGAVSSDGGETWTLIPDIYKGESVGTVYAMACRQRLVVIGTSKSLYVSVDGGWKYARCRDAPEMSFRFLLLDSDRLYAAGYASRSQIYSSPIQ